MSREKIHPAARDEETLWRESDVRRVRRSGPGGQHRNKVESGIVLLHRSTGISAEASERRSQADNRRVALRRLRINLALDVRWDRPDTAMPSELWQSRCRQGRIVVSTKHDDFPTLLAEALDALFADELDVKTAAGRLGCTGSQFVKFLKSEPRALMLVNARRTEQGLNRLK
jgi:hypothetical protein